MGSSYIGSVNKPSKIIQFNKSDHTIKPATLLAKKRNGEIIGQIKYTNLQFSFVGKGLDEISFQVHKKVDNVECSFWDKLQGMLIVDYVDYGQFEATFTINDADETIKNCTAVSLETELSQYTLHEEAHYNDEQAITTPLAIDKGDDGKYIPLMICNTQKPDHSVVHRILKDKAPHWNVGRVSPYLNVNGIVYETNGFQREFNFEGKTIYAALQDIQEECNCLFTFDTYNRLIDLWNIEECVFEKATKKVVDGAYYSNGKLYDKDANELSSKQYGHAEGIGNDTNIFVTKKQLAQDFTINEDKDSVKNCFYVKGGDDVMTNIVAAANVTGDNYIMMFDQFQYDDMPQSLVEKIKNYQELLKSKSEEFYKVGGIFIYDPSCSYKPETQSCVNKNGKILTDAIYNPRYNWVYVLDNYAYQYDNNVYDRYDAIVEPAKYEIKKDTGLYVQRCQLNDRIDWLKNSKFPNTQMDDTTAETQFNLLVNWFNSSTPPKLIDGSEFCQKVIIQNTCSETAFSHVTSTVQTVLGVICDSRYDIDVLTGDEYELTCTTINAEYPDGIWQGHISIKNNADETDKYEGDIAIDIHYVAPSDIDQSKDYLEQKFNIALAKMDIADLDYYDKTDDELISLFHQYNYNSLCSFKKAFASCCDTLDSIYPKSDSISDVLSNSYYKLRDRYHHLKELITPYNDNLYAEIQKLETSLSDITEQINSFRSQFNMRTYLGEDDYKLFRSYIREDEYSNENYTSEGLNTYQTLEKAKELLDVANTEIKKACVLQRTVSANLNNIFALDRYNKLYDDFAIFNYIRAEIDGMIYKLRIVQLDYNMDDLGTLSVKFSDSVTYTDGTISDLQSMKQAVSDISTSFASTTYQAKQGANAMSQFHNLYNEGINSTDFVVKNSTDEEVVIDSNGINCKSQNDIGMYGLHQCRVIGNGVYLTDDGWATSPKAAIGLMKLNGMWKYGVIADTIIGKMIVGETLEISDTKGTVKINGDGIRLSKGAVIDWGDVDAPSIDNIDGLSDNLKNLSDSIDQNAKDFSEALTTYKKEIAEFQKQVDTQFSTAGVTKIGDTYVYSPKIGAGYLYISKDGCSVEIDPSQSYNANNTNVIKVTANNEDVFYVTRNGSGYLKGDLVARSLSIEDHISIGNDEDGKDYVYISKDGLLKARNAVIYGTIYATNGKFSGELEGATGTFSGDLSSNRIRLNPKSDVYRGLIRTTNCDDQSDGNYKVVEISNDYASDSDLLGVTLSFTNKDTSQYYATTAFGVYKKNGSTFVKSHSSFYAMNGIYFNNNKLIGFRTTNDNGLYSIGKMGINGVSYTDCALGVHGKTYIDGTLIVTGNGIIKQLDDGGHTISMGWTGDTIQALVDATYMDLAIQEKRVCFKGVEFPRNTIVLRESGSYGETTSFVSESDKTVFLLTFSTDKVKFGVDVYTKSNAIVKSDRNSKHDINTLDNSNCKDFIMSLKPSEYKYNDGTSNRIHHGFIAQEVKEAMGTDDWGVYVDTSVNSENSEEDYKALRYEELIADLVGTVQYQQKEIDQLKKQINGED